MISVGLAMLLAAPRLTLESSAKTGAVARAVSE